MNKKRLSDDEIEFMIIPYSLLAHTGFKCVKKEDDDLTDDLKKVVKI